MRNRALLWITAATALVFGGAAQAADMPLKAPRVAAPAPFSWTGFYVGAHVGGAWGTVESELPIYDDFVFPISSHTINGFVAGGQAGVNWQVNSWLVLGVEGQFSWTDMKGSTPCVLILKCTTEVNWISTVAGRIGYTFDRTMLYVKGGVAWADSDYSASLGPFAISASDTRTGVMVGAGIEYAFLPNWSAKLEYNYIDFDTDTLGFPLNGGGCGSDLKSVSSRFCGPSSLDVDVTQKIHLIKFGVNYRFNWGAPAVVARY
jgi:outer membrane immunogenic protein